MPAQENDNILDDNKTDFELLTRRRRRRDSCQSSVGKPPTPRVEAHSQQSSPLASDSNSELIWPLHLIPTFVDHYVIGDVIGHGSYAEVRECVDTRTLERFAMKIINKGSLLKQANQALSNQLQEIKLLRHLKHANIIVMKECLSKGNFVYIILEYCSFNLDELRNDQKDGKFHVSIGRRFFHQLCLAVSYLHSLGIVHRDIKPQNMLLTNCGKLKLTDFGVSNVLSMWDQSNLCNNYEGSPLFQAPEIVVGRKEYEGFKADVWSCGVSLFLLLYGQYPFIDEALLGLYDKILAQEFVIPQCEPTSMALTDLLVSMLEKDCSRRANLEQLLDHPWMRCLGAADECDELEYSEFFDLVVKRHNDQQKWSQIHATSKLKDMYRSMTVLPYLYRHHFPDLPIRRSRRGSPDSSDSNAIITRINSLSSTSDNNPGQSSPNVSKASVPSENASPSPSPSPTDSGPHDMVDTDNRQIEWGTKQQYHLMKVPQIRANRIRCGASSKFKGRRKDKKTKHHREE